MFALLTRTFEEVVYLEISGSYNVWEIEVECHGSIEPSEFGGRDIIEIDGLQVVGASVEGESVTAPHLLDWLDQIISRLYWGGDIEEELLEGKVRENVEQ